MPIADASSHAAASLTSAVAPANPTACSTIATARLTSSLSIPLFTRRPPTPAALPRESSAPCLPTIAAYSPTAAADPSRKSARLCEAAVPLTAVRLPPDRAAMRRASRRSSTTMLLPLSESLVPPTLKRRLPTRLYLRPQKCLDCQQRYFG